jgi:DNA repair exonuclease SbcCD ATPase subunit
MKLTRIRIEQFRQFRQPLEISDLQPGLNLFTGPNEAGKSTVVAAIRAAFFERHRSSSVEDLRPWGDSTAAPSVELDFQIGATAYRLRKSFLARKRCELQVGDQQLDGAAAEDRLAELLGFQYAGKGASAAQHWGIPGLLWVSQGSGQQVDEPLAHAADHLRSALNASLGDVASSGGDEVLAVVEAQRNELLTKVGGTPREAFAEALRVEAEATTALQALDTELERYRQQVDQLDSLRRAHQADAAEQPWARARQQEQAARQRLSAAQGLQSALATEHQRQQQMLAQQQLLRQQLQGFADEDTALARRRATLEEAAATLASAQAQVAPRQARLDAANTSAEAARSTARQVRQSEQRAALAREREALALKSSTTAAALQRAEDAHAAVQGLHAQAQGSALSAPSLKTLRSQAQRLRELQIQRDAVATRLRFSLTPGHRLQLGTEALAGEGERLLSAPATLDLGALGQLHIAPGGGDLAELTQEQSRLADAQQALLQTLGLASLEAAEERQLAHTQHLAALQAAQAGLRALAPEGLDTLRSEAQAQAARAQALAAVLAEGSDAKKDPTKDVTTDAEMGADPPSGAALPTLSAAEQAEEAARRAVEQAQAQLTEARLAVGQTQAQADAAQREQAAALARVSSADRAGRLQATQQALGDALAEHQALQARVQALQQQLAQAQPELAQQDVQRYQRSAEAAEQAHAERQSALLRLEVALEAAGAQGLDERRALLATRAAQATRRAAELRRRAAALDHLLGLLRSKRAALTLRLQAPLQRHIDHYLPLLLPQAQLQIDQRLAPALLTRPGTAGPEAGPFEALSFGAREQMGLISRLAYADLLREAGRPTLLILDDALVHSDDNRLAQMKRILFDAATRHQVLLFSCHPAHWRDLGVAARTLDSLRWPETV